ncbi:MAG: DUF533 domain-containing protein [Proteobacteria bacterium]|nr:DUF533 domain-containing protein [Pseudomonadota bacterium]MBS0572905.1 DUF533 domain-containing protein [Pseudomonadota bacterium]
MSFIKTLATLAIGVAAAKGYDRFRQAGGMAGLEKNLRGAGAEGGMADQMGKMAERMGVPGGAQAMRDLAAKFGPKAADAGQAAEAGLGNLMSAMQGAMAAGAGAMGEMVSAMTGAGPASAAAEENAKLMIRAMIQAARADGELDADEKARIMSHLESASDAERAFVEAEMNAPVDPVALATAAGTAMKAQVYSAALMAVTIDNAAEVDYLRRLSAALGLDPAARDAIHAQMGLSPLATA